MRIIFRETNMETRGKGSLSMSIVVCVLGKGDHTAPEPKLPNPKPCADYYHYLGFGLFWF